MFSRLQPFLQLVQAILVNKQSFFDNNHFQLVFSDMFLNALNGSAEPFRRVFNADNLSPEMQFKAVVVALYLALGDETNVIYRHNIQEVIVYRALD